MKKALFALFLAFGVLIAGCDGGTITKEPSALTPEKNTVQEIVARELPLDLGLTETQEATILDVRGNRALFAVEEWEDYPEKTLTVHYTTALIILDLTTGKTVQHWIPEDPMFCQSGYSHGIRRRTKDSVPDEWRTESILPNDRRILLRDRYTGQ